MNEKELHLLDYIKIIRKRSYILFTFSLIVFVIVLIHAFTATPVYLASTKVLIEKNEIDPLSGGNYYKSSNSGQFLETQYQIITSTRVAHKVVDLLSLDINYSSYFLDDDSASFPVQMPAIFSALLKMIDASDSKIANEEPNFKGIPPLSKAEKIAEKIAKNIVVDPVADSNVLEISYMSTNPLLAQLIVNTITKAYMEEVLEMKMSASGYTIKWMTEKAQEEREKLERSEKSLHEYMQSNDLISGNEDRVALVPQKLAEVGSQLTLAEAKRKELETIYAQLKKAAVNSDEVEAMPVVSKSATIQSIREQILIADQQISELSKKLGRKHPAMIRAVDDLKGLQEKKNVEIRRVVDSIRNEYELARSNEKYLKELLFKTKGEALNLSEKNIQFGILKREVETNKLLYNALMTKMKEQSVTEQIQTINVWVVEKAKVPTTPETPDKKQNIMLGIVVGLLGGAGLCFFVDYLDNTVKSPDEAEERLGISVLGVIEKFEEKGKNIDRIVLDEPRSMIAESYKAIRTSLLLSSADSPPKSMVITSMSPKEGKSTTAINIAMAFAQSELKVVLIDADMRKPRVHKAFSLPPGKGLSSYLAGASDIDTLLSFPADNLTVITAGPIPPNPSELLSSNKMKTLIDYLSERYDMVIIDSPPLMSVTDAVILSKMLDGGAVLVAKAGETTYDALEHGIKSLRDLNCRSLGLILNSYNVAKSDYYRYGYYKEYSTDEIKSA